MPQTKQHNATREQRIARGRSARIAVPRSSHAEFPASGRPPGLLALLASQDTGRVPELLPVRYGRMAVSSLAYFQGAALPAAHDLAATPRTGLLVQACGDAHLMNFGLFASPGRRVVFDIADFDETLPAPWEWDVKRLAASIEVTGRENGHPPAQRRRSVLAAVEAYGDAMHDFAGRSTQELWCARADAETLRAIAAHRFAADRRRARAAEPGIPHKLTKTRQLAQSPSAVPLGRLAGDGDPATLLERLDLVLARYRRALGPDRRALLDRYHLADVARKAPGVGGVGVRSWLALLLSAEAEEPLFLQVKEARPSVLAPYTDAIPGGDGRRVVTGQRQLQAIGDVFLGWVRADGFDGLRRDFYFRQLRDDRGIADVTTMPSAMLRAYARLCGWTLARAHARTGDPLSIAVYLGTGPAFAEAVREFAVQCADRTERDHTELRAAIRAGRIPAAG